MRSAALYCVPIGHVNTVMAQHPTDTQSCDAFRYSFSQLSINISAGERRSQAMDALADISEVFADSTDGLLQATGQSRSAGPELMPTGRDRRNRSTERSQALAIEVWSNDALVPALGISSTHADEPVLTG